MNWAQAAPLLWEIPALLAAWCAGGIIAAIVIGRWLSGRNR